MIVLVGVGLTFIIHQLFYIWVSDCYDGTGAVKRPKLLKVIDRKPFNCEFCISFWIALGFFLSTQLYPAFIIPIAYRIIKQLMSKL